ncbi:hypothetical protein KAR91_63605, partial [Candidatus Pacearchaeota archaeon]|nr:hypothetical protein [Candidatus Pacearchaeota archaeon]
MNSYSFVADEFWNSIHQTLETGAASISTFNKKDTLDFKLLDDSKVYIPTLQLSGCFSGQMSDTALPLVSTKTKAEDFSITACANGWIDYPAKEALSLINGLLNEKSYFQRIKNYDNIREKSATYIYARLENEMATSQNIKWDFFFPPDCETLSRYLRLDFQTQDTMAVIEKSALGLMSQYGASEAFERISNLPVSIPDIIVSEMLKEHENGTYDLSEKIFSPSDGVISTFQKLRLQFQLQNALGIEDVLIIQFVKDFLNDWPEKVLAFVQVLKWAHRIVNDLPDAQQYRPEQRLLFTWLHGGTIFKIVFNGTKRPFSAIQEIFDNMDFYTAEQYITNDVPFDEIAEKPEGISPEYLLLQGLNYSCASDKSLEIIASLSKEIQSVVCVKDMTEIVSPFIFNGRSNAKKRIGQFFTASAQELMDRFKLGFSAKIVITSGFDNLFENALLKISSQETCLDGWAMLRIYGTEWLNDHQLKEIRSHLKSFNVSSLLEKDRDFTLKACRTISDFSVRGIAPEAQEIIQKMIMDIATYLSSLHKGADCTAEDTIQYTDLLQLSEIVFSFAEGLDLRLSVDSFCTTIRTVINIWPESAAFWKPVLNNFNNGIRFEYTDPIWKIYNETRIYD